MHAIHRYSKRRFRAKERKSFQREVNRSFIEMFVCNVNHLISEAAKENSRTTVYTFHRASEVEATALWLPIRGKCPEIYRVIVRELGPSRWPSKKDWLDAGNDAVPLLTDFYLQISHKLFLSTSIGKIIVLSIIKFDTSNLGKKELAESIKSVPMFLLLSERKKSRTKYVNRDICLVT